MRKMPSPPTLGVRSTLLSRASGENTTIVRRQSSGVVSASALSRFSTARLPSSAVRMDQPGREHTSAPSYGTGRQASGVNEIPVSRCSRTDPASLPLGVRAPSNMTRDGQRQGQGLSGGPRSGRTRRIRQTRIGRGIALRPSLGRRWKPATRRLFETIAAGASRSCRDVPPGTLLAGGSLPGGCRRAIASRRGSSSTRGQLGHEPGSSHADEALHGSLPPRSETGATESGGGHGTLTQAQLKQMDTSLGVSEIEIEAACPRLVWQAAALSTRGQTGSVPASSHAGLVLSDRTACGLRRSSLI